MKISDAHPSHDLFNYWLDTGTIHDPSYKCRACDEIECSLCPLDEESPLAVTCLGYSCWDSMTVFGDDGITRTVKRSKTGWF